jgi:NAD(P)-dependent dehydrogenase (short-subunit alcohol dehydrogenase family)
MSEVQPKLSQLLQRPLKYSDASIFFYYAEVKVGERTLMPHTHQTVLVGAVEELGQSPRTRALVTEQFETNFFSPVNMIKHVWPTMRHRKNGHIIVLSGTSK